MAPIIIGGAAVVAAAAGTAAVVAAPALLVGGMGLLIGKGFLNALTRRVEEENTAADAVRGAQDTEKVFFVPTPAEFRVPGVPKVLVTTQREWAILSHAQKRGDKVILQLALEKMLAITALYAGTAEYQAACASVE